MEMMKFTKADVIALRKRCDQAVKDNEEEFEFQGNQLVVSYAKYLLEYLESQPLMTVH